MAPSKRAPRPKTARAPAKRPVVKKSAKRPKGPTGPPAPPPADDPDRTQVVSEAEVLGDIETALALAKLTEQD